MSEGPHQSDSTAHSEDAITATDVGALVERIRHLLERIPPERFTDLLRGLELLNQNLLQPLYQRKSISTQVVMDTYRLLYLMVKGLEQQASQSVLAARPEPGSLTLTLT